jgi:dihydroorotase
MDGEATAKMAARYPGLIVGIKTAHFNGPEWIAVEQAVIAGTKANIPVMVDFGADRPTRPLYDLLTKKLRPGDIYTHMYSGLRQEQDPATKGPQKGMIEGRARGIILMRVPAAAASNGRWRYLSSNRASNPTRSRRTFMSTP